jgi:hypothetical protein
MKLVDEIIARVNVYHIILVRGTPASGKSTLMQLVVNKLLEVRGHMSPIHVLYGWNEKQVGGPGGWNTYLRRLTGVRGDSWPNHPAYLLLDEAQESYWDGQLWSAFFKSIDRFNVYSPFVVVFSSYGSPGRGNEGFDERMHIKTPMAFAPEQLISMRPNESIGANPPISIWSDEKSTDLNIFRPVGLLLEKDEAIDVMKRCTSTSLPLSADLKTELFLISDGHVGVLRALLGALGEVPVSIPRNLQSRRNVH